jgi:peptidoglycan/LPS O-acetylase OafA/YrhL
LGEGQRFRRDIQGLRGLAVVPVVLYHSQPALAPGGFLGVDVFFVISGYLIARILWRELENGSFSLTGFYARRVRRLFPALYVLLAATALAGVVVLPPAAFADLGAAITATALFCSNLLFITRSGYFAPDAALDPLLHGWSLGVEEQFYLTFPLFLMLAHRLVPRHVALPIALAALASLLLNLWVSGWAPKAAFYLPVTRAYELLIGALVALARIPQPRQPRVSDALSIAGLAMIAASVALIGGVVPPFPLAPLIPCIGCALVLHAGEARESAGGRLIGSAVPCFFGAISYSLYLWHWPAIVLVRYLTLGSPTPAQLCLAAAVSVPIAWASWRLVERPFLRTPASRAATLRAGSIAVVVAAAAGTALFIADGVPQRFGAEPRRLFEAARDIHPQRDRCHAGRIDIPYARKCILGKPGARPDTAIWADSFGAELAVAMGEAAARRGGAVMQITSTACAPTAGEFVDRGTRCSHRNAEALARLLADRRIRSVVMTAHFLRAPAPALPGLMDGFARAAERLHGSGKRIVLVYPVPALPFSGPAATGMLASRGADPAAFGTPASRHAEVNRYVVRRLDALARRTAAQRIVSADTLCTGGRCVAYARGVGGLYFDDHHLSVAGARHLLATQPGAEGGIGGSKPGAPPPVRHPHAR